MQIITDKDYTSYASMNRPESAGEVSVFVKAANALLTTMLGIDDSPAEDQLLDTREARRKYFLNSPTASNILELKINDNIIDPTMYSLRSEGVILLKFNPPDGYMDVKYEQGGLNPIPDDLKLAALQLVDYWWKRDYRQATTFGGETVTFNATKAGLPEHIRMIVEAYRRI